MQIFNGENYKILIETIKYDLNKWREITCSWKDSVSPILSYRFDELPTKIPK